MSDEPRTDQDEAEDPGVRGPRQNEDAEVEGHKRHKPLNETDDDEPEVEGHKRQKI